jgi:hypothetical protein
MLMRPHVRADWLVEAQAARSVSCLRPKPRALAGRPTSSLEYAVAVSFAIERADYVVG